MPFKDPEKKKAYHKKWIKKNGLTYSRARRLSHMIVLDRIKMEVKCEFCGFDKSPRALEFHHLSRENKSFGISSCISRNLMDLLKETEKCLVLCSNCHRMEEARLNKDALY